MLSIILLKHSVPVVPVIISQYGYIIPRVRLYYMAKNFTTLNELYYIDVLGEKLDQSSYLDLHAGQFQYGSILTLIITSLIIFSSNTNWRVKASL